MHPFVPPSSRQALITKVSIFPRCPTNGSGLAIATPHVLLALAAALPPSALQVPQPQPLKHPRERGGGGGNSGNMNLAWAVVAYLPEATQSNPNSPLQIPIKGFRLSWSQPGSHAFPSCWLATGNDIGETAAPYLSIVSPQPDVVACLPSERIAARTCSGLSSSQVAICHLCRLCPGPLTAPDVRGGLSSPIPRSRRSSLKPGWA